MTGRTPRLLPSGDGSWRHPLRLGYVNDMKKAELQERLYGEYSADVWQAYLMSAFADDSTKRAGRFRDWLAGQFNTKPWDQIVANLITASGKMEDNPAVTYLIEGGLPRAAPDLLPGISWVSG